MATNDLVPPDVLLLLDHPDTLTERRAARARLRLSGHPTNDGDGDGAGDGDGDDAAAATAASAAAAAAAAADGDGAGDGAGDGDSDDDGAGGGKEPDWKTQSRKHEARAKKAVKDLEAALAKLAARETADLSEQEKAIKDAKEAGRAEALTESEKTRRADKLELAVTRLAASKGVIVGSGDDAKTVKFSDPDDVQMWLERQIAKGIIDVDDIYSDGKVDQEALTEALVDLATDKPQWLAGAPAAQGGVRKPAGDPDGGKGSASKSLEDLSVEDHIKRLSKGR